MKVKGATFRAKRRRTFPDVHGCSFDVPASTSAGIVDGDGNPNG